MCVLNLGDDLREWDSAMVSARAQESHPGWSDTESELGTATSVLSHSDTLVAKKENSHTE
jgi:hypothetical protein